MTSCGPFNLIVGYYGMGRPISGGFTAFGLLAIYGIRLMYKGLTNDIYDFMGERNAPRWSYIVFGALCVMPLVGFVVFLVHQGYFQSNLYW